MVVARFLPGTGIRTLISPSRRAVRSRRGELVGYGLIGLAACLAPLILAPAVAYWGAVQDMRAELGLRGIYVLDRTEGMFDAIEQALGDTVFEARRGCEDRSLEALAVTAAAVPEITRLGIAIDGVPRCDSVRGRALDRDDPVASLQPGVLRRLEPGRMAILIPEADGPRRVHAAVTLERSSRWGTATVFAEIPHDIFTDRFGALVRSAGGMIALTVGDHTERVGSLDAAPLGGAIEAGARSSVYPVAVSVAQSWSGLAGRWLPVAAAVVALGLIASGAAAGTVIRRARARLSPRDELELAIAREEFRVVYLPSVDLASGLVTGAEALVRWDHPEQGPIRPDLFIPLAEETGLIVPITDLVLRRVAGDLGGLLAEHPDLHVSVNLAPVHLADSRILDTWRDVFAGSGIRAGQTVFEVTERGMIEDGPAADTIAALRAAGAGVAIDDFGTGYCSLAYLQRFAVDTLKIDRSFVEAIGTGSVGEGVLDSIIALGHRLGLGIVAEGVETAEQASALAGRGVAEGQGWYFSKPLDADAFRAFALRRHDLPAARPTEARRDPALAAGPDG